MKARFDFSAFTRARLLVPLAAALGGGAVALQWAWAAPVTNGWFCTGRLACWVWTRANLPAYMIADLFAGGDTDRFEPIAIGIFVQWLAVGCAVPLVIKLALQPDRP